MHNSSVRIILQKKHQHVYAFTPISFDDPIKSRSQVLPCETEVRLHFNEWVPIMEMVFEHLIACYLQLNEMLNIISWSLQCFLTHISKTLYIDVIVYKSVLYSVYNSIFINIFIILFSLWIVNKMYWQALVVNSNILECRGILCI